MLKSTIHSRIINSYFTQERNWIYILLRNIFQLWFLINKGIEMITNNETITDMVRKRHIWWIQKFWIKNGMTSQQPTLYICRYLIIWLFLFGRHSDGYKKALKLLIDVYDGIYFIIIAQLIKIKINMPDEIKFGRRRINL